MVVPASSSSGSTPRSHRVTWSSAPDAANIESSLGCHSMEVMGAWCHVKEATGVGFGAEVLFHDQMISVSAAFHVFVLTLSSLRSEGPKS